MVSCVGRYMAPELYRGPRYEKSVDVFSFALIVQEVSSNSNLLLPTSSYTKIGQRHPCHESTIFCEVVL